MLSVPRAIINGKIKPTFYDYEETQNLPTYFVSCIPVPGKLNTLHNLELGRSQHYLYK